MSCFNQISAKQSPEQYIQYLQNLKICLSFSEEQAVAAFRAGTVDRPSMMAVLEKLMEEKDTRSHTLENLLKIVQKDAKPLRDSKMLKLFKSKRRDDECPLQYAERIGKLITDVYSERPSRGQILRDFYLATVGDEYAVP